jgi:predicted Ser/Thr protein kinase
LVETPITDVEIIGSLGYGKNGVVFLAVWNGKKIALKRYDVGKDGNESFDDEVEAYTKL